MPKFVPVVDVEKARSEQNINDASLSKHRKFDNPFAIGKNSKPPNVDRGWEQGSYGFGVLGSFGSNEKDDGAQVVRRTEGKNKMVRNEKGLWVKAKELPEDDRINSNTGRGRGGGVSVLAEFEANYSKVKTSKVNDEDERYQDKDIETHRGSSRRLSEPRDKSRSRDRHRELSKYDRDRDRAKESRHHRDRDSHRDRVNEYDSRRRHRHASRSRDRSRSDSRDRARSYHSSSRDKHASSRSSRKSRSRSRSRDKEGARKHTHEDIQSDSNESSSEQEEGIEEAVVEVEMDEEAMRAEINAVQVVNRFLEVFEGSSSSSSCSSSLDTEDNGKRCDAIAELFAKDCTVCSMKRPMKVLLAGVKDIRNSFMKTTACKCEVSYRLLVLVPNGAGPNGAGPRGTVSYCLDLHGAGTLPGLGDRRRDGALLYMCQGAVITQVWGMGDAEEGIGSKRGLSKSTVLTSKVWKLARDIIIQRFPALSDEDIHFHDYNNIQTWG